MLSVRFICHGTLKEDYLRMACAEYMKRLGGYCRPEILEAKDDKALAALIKEKDYNIALCVEGKELSSPELAKLIDTVPQRGFSTLSFVIGGSDGLPESTKALCHYRLSFSRMTFPHQLMRVILLEQTYRAFNINGGGKYHK
ncbi:MAG: 23S rRNA (pseudouridine(1915)-N(3))-methyltransferase RlmH [Clostridia bacterium]|nr:23S rRNA (pseudouridine(1915)-N(3))-methyltransferase RlmH [Clostridia bacterium]